MQLYFNYLVPVLYELCIWVPVVYCTLFSASKIILLIGEGSISASQSALLSRWRARIVGGRVDIKLEWIALLAITGILIYFHRVLLATDQLTTTRLSSSFVRSRFIVCCSCVLGTVLSILFSLRLFILRVSANPRLWLLWNLKRKTP